MTFLFRSGTVREKASLILRATRMHARNLAKFAAIYKATCLLLKKFGPTPGKEGMSLFPSFSIPSLFSMASFSNHGRPL